MYISGESDPHTVAEIVCMFIVEELPECLYERSYKQLWLDWQWGRST